MPAHRNPLIATIAAGRVRPCLAPTFGLGNAFLPNCGLERYG